MNHFFYRNWWFFYILLFFLIGWFVYSLLWFPDCGQFEQPGHSDERIAQLEQQLKDCKDNRDEHKEIEDRRQERGGQIGELTFSLMWNTQDDLDLSVVDPSGDVIFHESKKSKSGGELDIDANRCIPAEGNCAITATPYENIFWRKNTPNGVYGVGVTFYNATAPRSNLNEIPFYLEVLSKQGVKKFEGVVSKQNPHVSFNYSYNSEL